MPTPTPKKSTSQKKSIVAVLAVFLVGAMVGVLPVAMSTRPFWRAGYDRHNCPGCQPKLNKTAMYEPGLEMAHPEKTTTPTKILNHKLVKRAGGLASIRVQMLYSDGTKSNGVVPSESLATSEAGRELLKAYVATKKGAKIAKYVPF
jgi:hypothetical protein